MILDPEKFRRFEHAGWEEIPAGYHEAFGSLTQQAIKPLLRAVRLKKGMSFLDIASDRAIWLPPRQNAAPRCLAWISPRR